MLRLLFALITPAVLCAQYTYREPVVFGRGHSDEKLASKIWIMEADGSNLKQLTSGTTYDDHPSLYSDRRHVLYSEFPVNALDREKGAKLIKLDIYTGRREIVAEAPGCALHHAALSPINDLLAYHRDCGKHWTEWVGWGPGSYEVNTIASNGVALPDGIIFMHERFRGIPGARRVSIARMYGHGPGSKMVFLTGDRYLHRRPAISPDGKLLAWQTNAAGTEDEIFLANIDGSGARNLTDTPGNDGHPWFSRDGRTIVFESDRTGIWEIWKIDPRTRKSTQLTSGGRKYQSTRPRM
jgi:Tol biopolymer transport system component